MEGEDPRLHPVTNGLLFCIAINTEGSGPLTEEEKAKNILLMIKLCFNFKRLAVSDFFFYYLAAVQAIMNSYTQLKPATFSNKHPKHE